jgi:hypothetical protein
MWAATTNGVELVQLRPFVFTPCEELPDGLAVGTALASGLLEREVSADLLSDHAQGSPRSEGRNLVQVRGYGKAVLRNPACV